MMMMICDAFIVFNAASWRRHRSNIKPSEYDKRVRSSNDYFELINILLQQYRVDYYNMLLPDRYCIDTRKILQSVYMIGGLYIYLLCFYV